MITLTKGKIMTMTKKGKKFKLRLPIETANLEIAREFVARIAKNIGFSDENIHRIELAVDEASTNVIKHAYKQSNSNQKQLIIEVTSFEDRIEIDVIDSGKGFDPDKIKTPEMDIYLKRMKRGGLGLYLIKTLMDKVEYQIKAGVKNRVRMIKYKSK
jgi:serine/threonine-protein kinase RsbW